MLSPGNLWEKNSLKLLNDSSVTETIRKSDCLSPNLCLNQFYFGGGKHFSAKTPHEFNYVLTLVLKNFNFKFVENLRKFFKSEKQGENLPFLNIFYAPVRRDFAMFGPLIASYFVLFAYVYFSVSKIEMVKSKYGLAFSAVFTVASSLLMTAGIFIQFQLTPTMWLGK